MTGAGETAGPYDNCPAPLQVLSLPFGLVKQTLAKKSKFNQGNENTQKQRKTLKRDPIIIV